MLVTLELKPEIEQRVVAGAAARGVSIDAYLAAIIEASAMPILDRDGTIDEFESDMDALAEGCEAIPILSEDAFNREAIYEGHD